MHHSGPPARAPRAAPAGAGGGEPPPARDPASSASRRSCGVPWCCAFPKSKICRFGFARLGRGRRRGPARRIRLSAQDFGGTCVEARMIRRSLATAVVALFLLVPTASAQDVVPLAGKGENFQPIARVKIPRLNEVEMAGDWAFLSQDKTENGEGGLVIVSVAHPTHPYTRGRWTGEMAGLKDVAPGAVALSPDGTLAVLTNARDGLEVL